MAKQVVILGGGFGGIHLLRELANDQDFQVTLVDRNNYNFFPPLLYQVATGFLEASNICYPYRKILYGIRNVHFRLGEFLSVNPVEKKIVLSTGELTYDYLVFATGATTNYFGMENVRQYAFPMKTVNDALVLRNHILQQLELATIEKDMASRSRLLNIVVAGGGPTGVEVSGMLADLRKHVFNKDYPELRNSKSGATIYLVDGLDAVLKPMSAKSQVDTYKALTDMGVTILLKKQVKDFDGQLVLFADGSSIATNTLIWAAGVTGPTFLGLPAECYGRGKRLLTDTTNRLIGCDDIFAIGDASIQSQPDIFPNGHPQLAQVAIQQGATLGQNLRAMMRSRPLKEFRYHDKGSMAIIGKHKAVVDLPGNKLHFSGFSAWIMWLFVHLVSLISARNKAKTLYNWMTAYFSSDQSLRMIIRPRQDTPNPRV